MIEYQSVSNELVVETAEITQNCGNIKEKISIDNYNSSCRYFLELKCPKGQKFISEEISFKTNVGEVILPNIVSANKGRVFVQLVIRDNEGNVIGRSFISQKPIFHINYSINAERDLTNEKVGDVVEFIYKYVNELKSISDILKQKLDAGELNGKDGPKGDQGLQGIQGPKGDKGDKGDQGLQGIQGLKGDKGEQGIQGIKGDKGEQGIQGSQGIKGDKGDRGIQGIKGDKGDKGDTPNILELVYPVGSIYISANSTSPASLFGGTWEQLKNKFLLASGSNYEVGATGGSADAVVVSHSHTYKVMQKVAIPDRTAPERWIYSNYNGQPDLAYTTSTTGENGIDKNMPPYLVVNMWKRIK